MPELWRNAVGMGAVAAILAVLAQLPRARVSMPVILLAGGGLAVFWKILDPAWALGSLGRDTPWAGATLLALWSLHAGSGWARPRAWWAVVGLAALFGDLFVALALAVAEPDPRRRARLVLAASGASVIGLGGAAPLVLGWGGGSVAVLGLVCAAVGFTPGGGTERAAPSAAPGRVLVPLLGAVGVWLAIAGGAIEFLALGLERLPVVLPRVHTLAVAVGAAAAGAVGDEGVLALAADAALDRGFSLRDDSTRQALVAGLGIGGGLPLLVLSRSSLKVGLPLWAVQLLLLAGWTLR